MWTRNSSSKTVVTKWRIFDGHKHHKKTLWNFCRHFQLGGTHTSDEFRQLGIEPNLNPITRARSTVHPIEQYQVLAISSDGKWHDAQSKTSLSQERQSGRVRSYSPQRMMTPSVLLSTPEGWAQYLSTTTIRYHLWASKLPRWVRQPSTRHLTRTWTTGKLKSTQGTLRRPHSRATVSSFISQECHFGLLFAPASFPEAWGLYSRPSNRSRLSCI